MGEEPGDEQAEKQHLKEGENVQENTTKTRFKV